MTDVIFLLLIFFMVTSTFVMPTALEVNLPESSQQKAIKPATTIYLDMNSNLFASYNGEDPQPMTNETLVTFLQLARENDPEGFIALYADEEVPYRKIVEILNIGADGNYKMVLATKPAPKSAIPQ